MGMTLKIMKKYLEIYWRNPVKILKFCQSIKSEPWLMKCESLPSRLVKGRS